MTTGTTSRVLLLPCHDEADIAEAMTAIQTQEALVRGAWVVPHAQAFVDAVEARGWANSFGTYPDHQPAIDRATDIFVPVSRPDLGWAICEFALQNWDRYGIQYVMFGQHINSNDGRGWRQQVPFDRGSITANHWDHAHIAYRETAPTPIPTTPTEENDMANVPQDQWDHLVAVVDKLERVLVGAPQPGEGPDEIDDLRARLGRIEQRLVTIEQRVGSVGGNATFTWPGRVHFTGTNISGDLTLDDKE